MPVIPDRQSVVAIASAALFGRPLLTNIHRSLLVEAMVSAVLPNGWLWNSGDWSSWDFTHQEGARLEVKQSAARQSWHAKDQRATASSFDIAFRTGAFLETGWQAGRARNADLYLFAHHPIVNETADHREATQWQFYIFATANLPDTRRIGVAALRNSQSPLSISELPGAIENARLALSRQR